MHQQRPVRARQKPSHPARPTTSKNPCKGSLAQLVEQLTFNQLVAGSNPARPTNVKKRPKGAFLLSAGFKDSNLRQVRVERSETTEPLAATARRASEASHPARPTNVKKRPKGAFLLSAICDLKNPCALLAGWRLRLIRPTTSFRIWFS